MTFYKANRRLVSSTGFIKSEDAVYDHAIYLGIHDSKENYQEATEEEYQEFLKKQEEEQDA